jgi:predicted transcriptional regulator
MVVDKKTVNSALLKRTMNLNIDDIISSLQDMDSTDRMRLQSALFELQSDLDLKKAINEGLEDIKSGRVSSHDSVMKEIKEKYS